MQYLSAKKQQLFAFVLIFYVVVFTVNISALSRGYITQDQSLRPGMVVSLVDENTVERADRTTADKAIGIAQTAGNSNLTFSSGEASLLVEISGEASVYVTDFNGPIAAGDNLSISPIKGVLMKADSGSDVFGVALNDMPEEGDAYIVETNRGNKAVKVSKITLSLDRKGFAGTAVIQQDSALKSIGRTVTGRDVSEIRVLVALAIFLIVMIAEGGIIYGAISSSIVSLGRNPLAGDIIRRELMRVLIIAIGVLVIGLAAIYAVLRV